MLNTPPCRCASDHSATPDYFPAVSNRGKFPYQSYFVFDRAVTAVLLSSQVLPDRVENIGIEPISLIVCTHSNFIQII